MTALNFVRPLLAGMIHSFEPDHIATVSALASRSSTLNRNFFQTFWKASQWALGHSSMMICFGFLTILLKNFNPMPISGIAETTIGPVMIIIGLIVIKKTYRKPLFTAVSPKDENFIMVRSVGNKAHNHFNSSWTGRSFCIGALHGLAGSGGLLTSTLILSAQSDIDILLIILFECFGIILTMGLYSLLLSSFFSNFTKFKFTRHFNGIIGCITILVGVWMIYKSFMGYIPN
jgi:nickel/cobalt transporter (NicO) family protein